MSRPRPTLALALVAGVVWAAPAARAADDDFGPVPDFTLTERDGHTVTKADLLGHVWVASFVFTRCTGPCPQVTLTMKRLQDDFGGEPGVRLVTFTVDPEHDDPGELTRYAAHFGADPHRWLFLTGREKTIYDLMEKGFRVPRPDRPSGASGPEVEHSTRLVVVDADGHVRGYFDGLRDPRWPDPEKEYEQNLARLRGLVTRLSHRPPAYLPQDLPRFNATLNATSAVLLMLGYAAVRSRRLRLHATLMLSALSVSAVFLASYLYYHLVIQGGRPTTFSERAPGAPEWVRHVYLGVLGTHTVLAVVVAPLALAVAYLGLRGRLARHARLARWTLPVWLYVSLTGVLVYWMLYRLYPAG
jgi:protein SCO1/2/putative membrane protein